MNEYSDFKEIVDEIVNLKPNKEYKCACAILFYDEAIELIKSLIVDGGCTPLSLDISPSDYDGYDKEFLITVDLYNEELTFSVEKLWHDDNQWHKAGYLGYEADILFIDADASSSALLKNGNGCADVITLEFDCEDECDEDDCCDECDEDDCCLCDIIANSKIVKDLEGNVKGIFINIDALKEFVEED